MERRFTGFLLPILIATLVWLVFFQNSGQDQSKAPVGLDPVAQDPEVKKQIDAQPSHEFDPDVGLVRHVFGAPPGGSGPGEGFRVTFSRYGAGIRFLALNDHFLTTAATARSRTAPSELDPQRDFYPLVPSYPHPGRERIWGYGCVLEGWGKTRFKTAIDDGPKNQLWEVIDHDPKADQVKFALDLGDGLRLEKVYRYVPGRRDLELQIQLHCTADRVNLPSVYDVRLRGVHVWNPKRARVFANPAAAVAGAVAPDGTVLHAYQAATACTGIRLLPGDGDVFTYAGTTSRFFGAFLFSDDQATRAMVTGVTASHWPPQEERIPNGTDEPYIIEANSVPEVFCELRLQVPPKGEATSLRFGLYLGPKSTSLFQGGYAVFQPVMDGDLDPANTGCCCPIPGVLQLAKGVVWVLKGLHSLVGNWGFAIVLLTLVVRILLSPLNFNMQRTMRIHGAKMAELKPQLDAIQKRYKDDPKQLQVEMMRFNREHKLISAPLKGCLPILITMPIWFGMFTALRVMYELRHEGFFGWIDDLSTPDRLFATGIDWHPLAYFNLLPILMVSLWIYLQLGTPLPKDPQQRQMMQIMRFMPIMMGVMLYNYAAGLMIYMCTSSIWGIVEQKVTKRILGPPNPDAGMTTMPVM